MKYSSRWWIGAFKGRIVFICLPATLLMVAFLVATIIFHMFYVRGTYGDTVLFSLLAWHNNWGLRIPIYGGDWGTFFNWHIGWFYWFPSAISYLLPLDRITFFALFAGSLHALLCLGIWLLLNELWPAREPWPVLIKCAAAAAFALNGHSQIILIDVDPEIAGPAFTLIFLWGIVRKNHPATLITFVLALSTREDMGFHIFAVLFLLLMTDLLRRVAPDQHRPILIYSCAAFGYSLVALALKYFVFDDKGLFQIHYLGPGTLNHVTEKLLSGRLDNLVLRRHWIWGPGVIALLWALASRNPYVVIAWLAFVPWLALSLMANNYFVGNLSLHYGYPFIIAGGWPLLAMSRRFTEPRRLPPVSQTSAISWALLLLVIQQPAQIYPKIRFTSWRLPLTATETVSKPVYDEFERCLPLALAEMTATRADGGVFSIAPYALDWRHDWVTIKIWNQATSDYTDHAPTERGLKAVIYFKNGLQAQYVRELIVVNGFHHHYWLPKTRIYLSTSEDIDNIPAFKNLFVTADPLPPEALSASY